MSALNSQAPRVVIPPSSDMSSNPTSSIPPLPSNTPARIDLLLSLQLHFWPALTHAIHSQWGGPSGTEKRDWLAGTLSDMLANGTVRDEEDLEDVLAQVMSDEFETVVEDGTLEEVADKIWRGVKSLRKGDEEVLEELEVMWRKWSEKKGKGERMPFVKGPEQDEEGETDGEEDEDSDEEMEDAPKLVDVEKRTERAEPEVDDEGFTKVVGRRAKR